MFRSIQSNTRPGLHINEDAVWGQEDFLFVIDGATGLSNQLYMGLESDARWFAAQTARLLCQLLPDKCLSIPAILHIAMENIQNQWLFRSQQCLRQVLLSGAAIMIAWSF